MKRKDREQLVKVLFREHRGTRCDFVAMARHTGIPVDTLRRYKRMPETIPLERLVLIAREMGVTAEELGGVLAGRTA